jgi:hypothetical protein
MEPDSFEILGELQNIKTIAAGKDVHARHWLQRKYGASQWRKMKATASVRDQDEIYEAEIHWYEAHGVGRCEWKIKARLD